MPFTISQSGSFIKMARFFLLNNTPKYNSSTYSHIFYSVKIRIKNRTSWIGLERCRNRTLLRNLLVQCSKIPNFVRVGDNEQENKIRALLKKHQTTLAAKKTYRNQESA
jgi:hypothetical protein